MAVRMKRQWRPGRIVLAVMLVGIAGLTFWVWPTQRGWSIPEEKLIGFDDSKALLYTVKRTAQNYELTAYDLHTGARKRTQSLNPINNNLPSNTDSDQKEWLELWEWILAPDKQVLIALNPSLDEFQFQLFNLETGALLRKIAFSGRFPLIALDIKVGFSDDGRFLALQDASEAVLVWDLQTGAIVQNIRSSIDVMKAGIFELLLSQLNLHHNPDYLAYSDYQRSALRDMKSKKDVLEHPATTVPRILDQGEMVVFIPDRIRPSNRPTWYHRQSDGAWEKMPMDLANGNSACDFFCYCKNMVVTDYAETVNTELWDQIPESF
jgi:WD40 repeat protein